MPVIQRHAEKLGHGGVKRGLHVVEGGRDDGEVEEAGWVDVVEEGVAGAPLVGEEGVRAFGGYGQGFPLGVEGGGGGGVVGGGGGVVDDGGDFGHCGDADDAFDGEVGLVDEAAGEVVGGELVAWGEGEFG